MKKLQTGILASLMLAMLAANGAELPTGTPEAVGMSSERLLRINHAMQRHIEAGDIQGAVTAVRVAARSCTSKRMALWMSKPASQWQRTLCSS